MQLRELLTASGDTDFARAKEALAKHLGKLVLTPVMHDGRPVYRVSGNVSVGAGTEKCRMQLVARDGYPQHSTLFTIPLNDVYLDPKLDLGWTNGVQ
jgi:hypothetical protein